MHNEFNKGESVAVREEYPRPSTGWSGVGVLGTLYMLSFVDRNVLNLLVDPISEALDIGDVEMSFLMGGAFAIVYGLMGLPLARLADSYNRRHLIMAATLFWGTCTILCGLATSFWALVLCRVGLAVGEAALSPAAYSMIADWFPPVKRSFPSTMYTWLGAFGNRIGMAALGVAFFWIMERQLFHATPLLSNFAPWQLMFFIVGAPTLVLALVFWIAIKEPKRVIVSGHDTGRAPPLREVFAHLNHNRKLYLGLLVGCGLNNLAHVAFVVWAPQILKRSYGWSIADAAVALGILSGITSIIGALLLPRLSDYLRDRFGRTDLPIVLAIAFSIVGCCLMAAALVAPNAIAFLALESAASPLLTASAILAITSLPIVAPARMRAVLTSLYLLITSALTSTVAPTLAALFSTYLFDSRGPDALAWGVAAVCLITPLFTVPLLAASKTAYAQALAHHLGEARITGSPREQGVDDSRQA